MADQCIVCLENLEVAVSDAELATSKGLDPGGDSLYPAAATAPSSTTTTTATANSSDESTPSNSDDNTHIAVINVCGHALHNCCLLEWAGKANSCPICRQSFHKVDVYDKVGGNFLKSYTVEDKKQVVEFDARAWAAENPENEEEEEESTPCPVCLSASDEDVLLLCDGCDAAYHTYCVGLDGVPSGSWFCMECEPVLGEVERPRPRVTTVSVNSRRGRRNDFFPRTRETMRRARRRARSDDWQGAWGEITGLIFDALDLDLDSHDGNDALEEYRRSRQLREREQREYQRWQQRLAIARRLGAQDVFSSSIPASLLQPADAQPAAPPTETREERRAWATLEKAREHNGEGSSHRKRKSRSVTASPAEPQPEPERKLKRPRTRRIGASGEASSSSAAMPPVIDTETRASASDARSPPRPNEEVPSFLSSLLKEVEQSNHSDDEAIRNTAGENRCLGEASSPGSSPSPSGYSSPRAMSLTPPPHVQQQQQARCSRPLSPTMSLSSYIEPIYPPANYLQNRSGDNSDSDSRSPIQGPSDIRQPRPRRSLPVRIPRSPEVSPTRPALPLEMKEHISSIVRVALKPHWKSSKLTADQYAAINRDVSRKLYEEITDPSSVIDDEARRLWENKATQEVARALSGLQA